MIARLPPFRLLLVLNSKSESAGGSILGNRSDIRLIMAPAAIQAKTASPVATPPASTM